MKAAWESRISEFSECCGNKGPVPPEHPKAEGQLEAQLDPLFKKHGLSAATLLQLEESLKKIGTRAQAPTELK